MRYNLHGMKMYLVSNKKVRKFPQKVPVLIRFIPNSLTTPNVLSHGDLKKFETIDCGVKPVQKKNALLENERVVKMKNGDANSTLARYAERG